MKCYIHRETDAIGVCTVCGRGICDSCHTNIGEKLYCKTCAGKVLYSMPVQPRIPERAKAITFASILFGLAGVLTTIYSLLIFQAFISPVMPFIHLNPKSIIIASINIILGPLGIFIAFLLWRSRKVGGILGVVVTIISIVGNLVFSTYPLLDISLNILTLILITVGWKSLV